ncbi:MAG: TlpA disulfide reductase family protein, partial [Burkholderiaceae bacterium]
PLVLNFWATWCPPCVEELPLLEAFYKLNAAKNWQVIGIAVDNAKAVKQFLGKMPLSFPTPVAGLAGTELSRSLGNVSGGLPFTVVFDASGQVALRHIGKLSAAQVDRFTAIQ